MRRVLFAAGLCASLVVPEGSLAAQQALPNTESSIVDSIARVSHRDDKPLRRDSPLMSAEGSGWSATKRGAWIGAGLGFLAGTYGGLRLAEGFGCTLVLYDPPRPCHQKRSQITVIAGSGVIGTLLGSLVGATVGKVVGLVTPDAPNR
jgi:hypothetical protein